MNIAIRKANEENGKEEIVWFPIEEEQLQEICNELGIEMTTKPNCYVEGSIDQRFLSVLNDKNCNIDELNYLMKRFDGFSEKEMKQFYATAFAENPKTMAGLINLSFNMHCYSLVTDFSNLNRVGKALYLSERQAVASRELDALDGEAYAMEIIKSNANPTITPYGVLYKNSNEPDQVYDGKHFPPYQWQEAMVTVELRAKGESEFIYLPCSDTEITKALMRLEIPYLRDCEVTIDNDNIPDKILEIIPSDITPVNKIDTLNKLASKLKEMETKDITYFEKLMDHIKPQVIDEVFSLIDSMYEFELFDGVKDIESYGRYMICESGHFEYDHNLEEYIDFKKYGTKKMAQEEGGFSDKGYIVYHGYNQKLSNLLFENIGIMIPEERKSKTLKLYMPLAIYTYDIENEYGYREIMDEPLQQSNHEVINYIDEILEAIDRENLPEEKERGLMTYYENYDSVNAKVLKYEFSVEMVDDELMGVAILTLNDDLTSRELQKIKDDITGQASDGWGEGFKQREISTDMGDVHITFWSNGNKWFIKTAQEMEMNQKHTTGGIRLNKNRNQVDRIKKMYPTGTRIELLSTMDDMYPIGKGTQGTVKVVDDIGTIHMKWDNGSGLGLIPGEDHFKVLSRPQEEAQELEEDQSQGMEGMSL